MAKRIITKNMVLILDGGAFVLLLIGAGMLLGSFIFNENVPLFDRGIGWIAVGIALMAIFLAFVNWDDSNEIKEQLDRIERKIDIEKDCEG